MAKPSRSEAGPGLILQHRAVLHGGQGTGSFRSISGCRTVVCFLGSGGASKLAMGAHESLNQMLQVD